MEETGKENGGNDNDEEKTGLQRRIPTLQSQIKMSPFKKIHSSHDVDSQKKSKPESIAIQNLKTVNQEKKDKKEKKEKKQNNIAFRNLFSVLEPKLINKASNSIKKAQEQSSNAITKIDLSNEVFDIAQVDSLLIENWETLAEVYLSKCKMCSFPFALLKLKFLKVLNLDYNLISELPEEFAFYSNLKEFSIADNRLTHLPKSFSRLQNLQSLILDKNYIEIIGAEITSLKKLEKLHIESNLFQKLPLSIVKLGYLQVLGLD